MKGQTRLGGYTAAAAIMQGDELRRQAEPAAEVELMQGDKTRHHSSKGKND